MEAHLSILFDAFVKGKRSPNVWVLRDDAEMREEDEVIEFMSQATL
jgi:hypothetical protein